MKTGRVVLYSFVFALALLTITSTASWAAGNVGTGPGTAVNIEGVTGKWETLAPNSSSWYSITYAGGTQDEVDLTANGVGGVTFSIVTPDGIAAWVGGNAITPIGVGSNDPSEPNYDLTWIGHPMTIDGSIYYVLVTNNNTTATPYKLNMIKTTLPNAN